MSASSETPVESQVNPQQQSPPVSPGLDGSERPPMPPRSPNFSPEPPENENLPPPKQSPPKRKDPPIVYAKIALFLFFVFGTSIGIIFLQIPSLLLLYHSHGLYRSWIRVTQQIFGSLTVILVTVFCPGTSLVLTGDFDMFQPKMKTILFANHQIYPDWVYMWNLMWSFGAHGDIKILLMQYLRLLPILGQGMWFFEFIFMRQKWDVDKHRITKLLKDSKNEPENPLFLMIFPEGTLNTPGNVAKSRMHAEKEKISPHPNHVLLPRSTGLHHCLSVLNPSIESVFDLTVGYSGLPPTDIPYYAYLTDDVYFRGKYPRKVHIHVERFFVRDLPGVPKPSEGGSTREGLDGIPEAERRQFTGWLRDRFMAKDTRMARFYATGDMVGTPADEGGKVNIPRKVVRVQAELQDWAIMAFSMYCIVWLGPYYWWLVMFFPRLLIFGF